MSEMSVKAREAAKRKVERLTTDPHQKVDASSWTPPEPENAGVQTGPRPVSKRQFRKGGFVVSGEHEHKRADRKPRKSGGRALVDDYVNRDVKEANEERDGIKHVGGMKKGGRAKRAGGGGLDGALGILPELLIGKKAGGSVSDGSLEGTRPTGGRLAHKHGGRADAHWIEHAGMKKGALHRELHVPEEDKIPAKKLAKAEHSGNKLVAKRAELAETLRSLPHRASGGATGNPNIPPLAPHEGSWVVRHRETGKPVGEFFKGSNALKNVNFDKYEAVPIGQHLASLNNRTPEGEKRGGKVREGRKHGGKTGKGKMSVNIVIAPGGGGQPQGAPPMAGPPMPPPHPIVPPNMPMAGPGGPPPGVGGPPPMMPPGAGMPPGGPPPMMRKHGGSVTDKLAAISAGAGGGLARLVKAKAAARSW